MKAHIALFFVSLIYAANYTIAKEVMPTYLTPDTLVFMRVLTGVVIFWILAAMKSEKVEKSDFGRLILCGVFGAAANMLFFFKGLNLTTPINASLLLLLVPIIVIIISGIFLKERITVFKGLGIILGILGAGFLVLNGRSVSWSSSGLVGDLLVGLNSTAFAIYLILVKQLMVKYNTMTVLKWVFTFGFIAVFPFTINDFLAADFTNIPINIWFAISFILICVTVLTYLFNAYALQYVTASVVSIYIYLQPLMASIIALSFGKDNLDFGKVMAYLLIFSGVLMVSQSRDWWKGVLKW
ncbi:MAG: DMT family transporter [Saprospiraceae bacterium]